MYQGVMYVVVPGGAVRAIDGANGKLIWEHKRKLPSAAIATPDVGVFYDKEAAMSGKPTCLDIASPDFPEVTHNYGSVKNAWPRIVRART